MIRPEKGRLEGRRGKGRGDCSAQNVEKSKEGIKSVSGA